MRFPTCFRASRSGASPEGARMFRDRSLVPAEAIRLAALVRFLTSRIVGPSPELMGSSLELLRYEGLVAPTSGEDPELVLSPDGRTALGNLLRANLRSTSTDLGKLGLALKLRFLG